MRWTAVMGTMLLGCASPSSETQPPVATDSGAGASVTDSGGGHGDSGSSDTGSPEVPLIQDALDCGRRAQTGSIPEGAGSSALEAVRVDTVRFPDALCNDGSTPVFYVRPAETAAGRDRWVIQLLGGGGCGSAEACAKRWCNVGTNFSMTQMSSSGAPDATNGVGIFARPSEVGVPEPQPFADANQVLVKYCSSDIWRGTVRDSVQETEHPVSGEPVQFRMHFLGRRIVEAVVTTLRQDGVAPIEHVGSGATLADLDDAAQVVLAGASAGGGGTTYTLDWLSDHLRGFQPDVEVIGLVDSTFGPTGEGLDFSMSTYCLERGICDLASFLGQGEQVQQELWGAQGDDSCSAHHAETGDTWWCASDTHVLLHHTRAPVFIRQGLNDSVISDTFTETGLLWEGEPVDLADFGSLVQSQFDTLRSGSDAREESDIRTVSAGYAPLCPKHETLRSTADTFMVEVAVSDTARVSMFEQWERWRSGATPSVVYARSPEDSTCP